uniref:Uncharacterized protein n=1 Tax=Graphocephala atropunctata TaxID=36148 RepID=A0A1B6KTJ5_9HEMI
MEHIKKTALLLSPMIKNIPTLKLNIFQWNCRSLKPKWPEIMQYFCKNQITIGIIQETWLNDNDKLIDKNYDIIQLNRYDGYGGTAIIVHKAFTFDKIDEFNDNKIQLMTIKLICSKKQIYIHNIYCTDAKIDPSIWKNKLFTNDKDYALICGDMNAHHPYWFCHDANTRGNAIFKEYSQSQFIMVNDKSFTTIPNIYHRQSVIDLTFATPDLYAHLTKWNVLSDPMGSNHFPIFMQFEFHDNPSFVTNNPLRKNFKKANWELYTKTIEDNIPELYNLPIENQFNQLLEIIYESANKAIPNTKGHNSKTGFKPKPWWTVQCSQAVAHRRLAFKQFRINMTPINYHIYQLAVFKAKEIINAAKKKGWVDLCQKIENKSSTTYAWNIIKKLKNPYSLTNKSDMTEKYELCERFMQHIIPEYVPHHSELHPPTIYETIHPLEADFNTRELHKALRSKTKDTSPGLDGITYFMIKNLPCEALNIILNLYNNIWNNKLEIPDNWKKFKIVALLKPGKDKDKENSYRPISLIPCFIKIMNTMVKNRLVTLADTLKIIPETQYAFRKNLGCADYLVHLTSNIQTALTHNETTILTTLDISNAYDNVHLPTLWTKMYIKGIPAKFILHCHKWLTDRQLTISFPNYEITRTSCRGIPQGSVLSPILFAIYIADINLCLPRNVKSLQYADDVALYASSKKYDEIQLSMQIALNNISKEFQNLNLGLNPSKSLITIFSRKRSLLNLNRQFYLEGQPILVADKLRLLGIIIDNKLTFKQHIEQLFLQCHKDLNILKMIACGRNGANPDFVLRVYKSLIRSKIDYCSFIYGHAPNYVLSKLETIQNQALRIAIEAFKSTPTIGLQMECSVLPLNIRRQTLAERLIYKIMTCPTHPAYQSIIYLNMLTENNPYWRKKRKPTYTQPVNLAQTINPIDNQYENFSVIQDFTLPLGLIIFNLEFNILINDKVLGTNPNLIVLQQEWYNMTNITYKNKVIIYTDGSKTAEGTGAAIYIPKQNIRQKYKLDENTSSYTAEMYAIFKAVHYSRSMKNKEIVICSDCQSVLITIKNVSIGILEGKGFVLNILREVMNNNTNKYILQWVPGHAGIAGNEVVDKLARDSVQEKIITREFFITTDDFKSFQNKRNKSIMIDKFTTTNKAQWYKYVNKSLAKPPWFKRSGMSRVEIINICRLRLGHANINTCLYRIKCYFTPLCLNCSIGTHETFDHLFMECPKYAYEREKCFKYIKQISKNFTVNLKEIISVEDHEIYQELNTFLKSIKRVL